MKSIIIAAPVSGSGKTTVTIGIMECLKRRGLKVAPFKVGPDFIDPGYHRIVTGQPSLNLDGWMLPQQTVRAIFAAHGADADIAVIEGAMGLFDGISGVSDDGSTAQISRLTGATVFLVVDAKGFARSIAALLKGFAEFDSEVRIGGVIFNNVSSENHARILREAVAATLPAIPVVGAILRDSTLHLPSRHLGLLTAEENELSAQYLDHLAQVISSSIDLGLLLTLAGGGNLVELSKQQESTPPADVRIAVARDRAFCFVYESNLQMLRKYGAELIEFSPLTDSSLPGNISGIYLPGGYPEAYATELAANRTMLAAVKAAIEAGMPVYAECGGFIYLTSGVKTDQESHTPIHELVNIFPVITTMLPQRKALGYREITLRAASILGTAGAVARGHEFHYSEIGEMPVEIERVYQVSKGGKDLGSEGYRYKNCLASYIHLHFGSNPGMVAALAASCRAFGGA
jgi:cobyrinic acid a,c-diamide synthase